MAGISLRSEPNFKGRDCVASAGWLPALRRWRGSSWVLVFVRMGLVL